jgi:hypothetical protein
MKDFSSRPPGTVRRTPDSAVTATPPAQKPVQGDTESEMQQPRKGDYVVRVDLVPGVLPGQDHPGDVRVASVVYEDDDVLYVNISYLNKPNT